MALPRGSQNTGLLLQWYPHIYHGHTCDGSGQACVSKMSL
eukprot:COSAG01_NODE_60_length_29981_cov_23.262533_36_plen_40_part_00